MADIEDVATSLLTNPRQGRVVDLEKEKENNNNDSSSCCTNGPVVQPASTRTVVPRSGNDIPGDATVYVHTFGCGHNVSDGEYMSGQLFKNGYRITDEFSAADCYLINSCTVKNPSEDHFVTLVRRAKATKKPVIVAGCVPSGDPTGAEWQSVSVIGVRQIHRVTEVVQEAMRGNTIRLFDTEPVAGRGKHKSQKKTTNNNNKNNNNQNDDDQDEEDQDHEHQQQQQKLDKLPSLLLPKVRRNKFIEIIPINVGCLNTCTYCKTKHARGDLQSWPVEEIVQRVKDSIAEGVREIYLTSEDTGAYGIDINTNIVNLLVEILKVIEQETSSISSSNPVMLRLGMTNPPYLIKHLDAIAPLFLHPNFYEFVHIPVQSGSDAILEIMKREYSVEDFKLCVKKLRKAAPKMTVSTDIICAFPFEGEKEWKETMDLCTEMKFPVLNISRFYPRRGTPAAAMKQIPTEVAKKRTQEISNLFNNQSSIEDSNVSVGDIARTWLVEVAYDKHSLVGHTKQFVQVLVDPSEAALGDLVEVKITEVLRFCAKATVVKVLIKDSDYVESLKKKAGNGNFTSNDDSTPKAVIEKDYFGGGISDHEDEEEQQQQQNKKKDENSCCGGTCCGGAENKPTEEKEKISQNTSSFNKNSSSSRLIFGVSVAAVSAVAGFLIWKRFSNGGKK